MKAKNAATKVLTWVVVLALLIGGLQVPAGAEEAALGVGDTDGGYFYNADAYNSAVTDDAYYDFDINEDDSALEIPEGISDKLFSESVLGDIPGAVYLESDIFAIYESWAAFYPKSGSFKIGGTTYYRGIVNGHSSNSWPAVVRYIIKDKGFTRIKGVYGKVSGSGFGTMTISGDGRFLAGFDSKDADVYTGILEVDVVIPSGVEQIEIRLQPNGSYTAFADAYFSSAPSATSPSITTTSLPSGTVGAAYSRTLSASGTTPITWAIASGSLPAGLSLSASTGAITGTPTAAGTSSFTVRASNSAGSDTKAFSITVSDTAPPPPPTTDGWRQDGGFWYYFQNGALYTGWLYTGGVWYYIDYNTGRMQTGWARLGPTWYFFAPSGAMRTGWLNSGGAWYYLNRSGAMHEGWYREGNTWYYLAFGSGAMLTGGPHTIDGAVYYFDRSGAWIPGA